MRALRHANEIRIRRARLKRELASGRARIDEIIAQPPEFAQTAKVYDLLPLALPKIGPAKAVWGAKIRVLPRDELVALCGKTREVCPRDGAVRKARRGGASTSVRRADLWVCGPVAPRARGERAGRQSPGATDWVPANAAHRGEGTPAA